MPIREEGSKLRNLTRDEIYMLRLKRKDVQVGLCESFLMQLDRFEEGEDARYELKIEGKRLKFNSATMAACREGIHISAEEEYTLPFRRRKVGRGKWRQLEPPKQVEWPEDGIV